MSVERFSPEFITKACLGNSDALIPTSLVLVSASDYERDCIKGRCGECKHVGNVQKHINKAPCYHIRGKAMTTMEGYCDEFGPREEKL